MWHASTMMRSGLLLPDEHLLRTGAFDALKGIGDESRGQWEEWTGKIYHVKRRLSRQEQRQTGDARDIRGTREAQKRRAAVQRYIPPDFPDWIE